MPSVDTGGSVPLYEWGVIPRFHALQCGPLVSGVREWVFPVPSQQREKKKKKKPDFTSFCTEKIHHVLRIPHYVFPPPGFF